MWVSPESRDRGWCFAVQWALTELLRGAVARHRRLPWRACMETMLPLIQQHQLGVHMQPPLRFCPLPNVRAAMLARPARPPPQRRGGEWARLPGGLPAMHHFLMELKLDCTPLGHPPD